jgi:hypothetical protein
VALPVLGFVTPVVPVTVMLNAASEALAVPSATVITIPDVVPASVAFGLPESCPVVVLKVAQDGAFLMENVMVPASESLALGVKVYCPPTVTEVGGVPEIVAVAAAVSAAVEPTVTPSPPPHPVRASAMRTGAQTALISLK